MSKEFLIDLKDVKCRVRTTITGEDIFDIICEEMDRNQIMHLIKSLDIAESDWDFTEELCNYFNEEMKKRPKDI